MSPRFAIVGHPNKGKSSIVATLAEDDSVPVSPLPGTTTKARDFPMRVDGEVLYDLVDTPGFQRAREVIDWLIAHEQGAEARPGVVREFLAAHEGDERFHDECELLAPILEGAGILYVVDGAHPYGGEYEAEMEVLRWTGQPRMALINLIGTGDHEAEWRRALDQYFSIVRVFDAVHADFGKRVDLLRAFGELSEDWAPSLGRAVEVLLAERARRRDRSANEIASFLFDALTAVESRAVSEDAPDPKVEARLQVRLLERIRRRERDARQVVQDIYQHGTVETQEAEIAILSNDLFSAHAFSLFGLSRTQLALTGATSGAIAGGLIDAALGFTSLGIAAGVGALIGGAGTLLGAEGLASIQVLGQSLGGMRLTVGPLRDPNVPWVMLGRALLHHRLVAERNHARREALVIDAESGAHLAAGIFGQARQRLEAVFRRLRSGGEVRGEDRKTLRTEIAALLD